MKFTNYFLGFDVPNTIESMSEEEKKQYLFSRPGILELTHNWGTENDPEFAGYHNGNTEPRGFGHIAITVNDLKDFCEKLELNSVKFVKKFDEGKMKGLAFISDPDGYWIEILSKDGRFDS